MYVSVILLAGGKGLRMGGAVPKQYMKLLEKEIALYSFELFNEMEEVGEIIVVADPDYRMLFSSSVKPVKFASPGTRRQDSLKNGLEQLSPSSEWVCIHDAARPLVAKEDVKRACEAAYQHGAAALGVPVKATLKRVQQGRILSTVDREGVWEIQTPQVIKRAWLEEGMELALKQNVSVTDDLSLMELIGKPAHAVLGSSDNIKVTTPEDLKLAEALLRPCAV